MNILLCTPYGIEEPRGNSIAAGRLAAGFSGRGHNVTVLDRCAEIDPEEAAARAAASCPDIVLGIHAWRSAGVLLALHERCRAPVVVSIRGTDINEMASHDGQGDRIRRVLECTAAVVVFSGAMRDLAAAAFPAAGRKLHVIPNGLVPPEPRFDFHERLGIDREAFVFVGVAGIREIKRVPMVIEALAAARAEAPGFVYVHAGAVIEGPAGREFDDARARHPWVTYVGALAHADIGSFLASGDLFVAAGRSEGMPHAVREAMACGLPALLSDVAGHRGMATDGREALFFRDQAELTSKALVLLGDAALRTLIGNNARERVGRDLRESDEISAYLAVFGDLVSRR